MKGSSSQKGSLHYALKDEQHCDVLTLGSNVIGRGPASLDGVSFIGIESPRGAVSRVQATIEIAPNGDAWVSDCGSTNGTYISVRPGTGIRLARDRFYQLSEGCTLVFGDVERRFVTVDDLVATQAAESKSRASSVGHKTPTKADGPNRTGPGANSRSQSKTNTGAPSACLPGPPLSAARRDTPYLADATRESIHADVRKRSRESEHESEDGSRAPPASRKSPAKPRKLEPTTTTAGGVAVPPLRWVVCTSGLEPDDKKKARTAAKRLGATLTEDIRKASLLVVGAPAVRTPKFIIAVARRVPIVAMTYFNEAKTATPESVASHITSLKDNSRTYSAEDLKAAIYREGSDPLLHGLTFNVHQLRGKTKQVAQEVIVGCGGEVTTRKADQGIVIDSEKSLNDLYDCLLRAVRP